MMDLKQKFIPFLIVLFAFPVFLNAQNSFWVKQGGDSLKDSRAIAVDKQGSIYYTGNFSDTSDFDLGPGVYSLISSAAANPDGSAFVSKLDASGNFVWAKSFSDSLSWGRGYGNAIATDDSGNVYTTGEFWGNVDFDPGPGVVNLPFTGMGDCFISKLDKNGNFVWAQKYAYPHPDVKEIGSNIKLDATGNIYIGVGMYYSFHTYTVLLKLTPGGNIVWTKSFNSNGDTGCNFTIGNDDNLYFAGTFQTSMSIPPFTLTGMGYTDSFFGKMDTSGTILWIKQIGGHYSAFVYGIALDNSLNIFLTGGFQDSTDFDPGPGVNLITSINNIYSDIFILKLDSVGSFKWVKVMGGNGYDYGTAILIDSAKNIYSTGSFQDTVDFDPDTSNFLMSTPYYSDQFYCKLDSSGNFIWSKHIYAGVHGFALDNAANIYTTGIFNAYADFDLDTGFYNLTPAGPVDIFIHKFRQCIPSTGNNVIVACDSLIWMDGNTYTSSTNTPVFTMIGSSSNNCDSIITLNLTIIHSTSSTDSIATCDSFTWLNGNTYTSSNNTATYTVTNSAGCDSVIYLNLTINTVDTMVSYDLLTGTLTASVSGALNYQWLNCDSGYVPITGANLQSFTPLQNGNYALLISQNGCADTSSCYPVYNVGVNELQTTNSFEIYPQPVKDKMRISGYAQTEDKVEISIYNILGKKVFTTTTSAKKYLLDISNLPEGLYTIIVNGKAKKFIKSKI